MTYQRSQVRLAQITDGTSKTALIGEKYMSPKDYETGKSDLDDQNIFVGHDVDNLRYTGKHNPATGTQRGIPAKRGFGSASSLDLDHPLVRQCPRRRDEHGVL